MNEERELPGLENLARDVRYALRGLRKSPGFATVAVLSLAVCIGANAAIFTAIRETLVKAPAYQDPDRLVLLTEIRPDTPGYSGAISAPNYLDWVQQSTVFEQIAAVTGGSVTLQEGTRDPVYVRGRAVSASYFDVFGLHAQLGRTFAPGEDHPTKSHVVVLSHRLWVSQFASDPSAIGKHVRLDGELHTVIGVMAAASAVDLLDPELWTPRDLGREGGALSVDGATSRNRRDLNRAMAKLKEGVTFDQARSQMDEIGRRLAQQYPESNRGWGVSVQRWPRPIGEQFEQSLYLLFAAAVMVFLIGCVNLANLTFVRAVARSREHAIRVALGARRRDLLRQHLMEGLILASLGGASGMAIAYLLVSALAGIVQSVGLFKLIPTEATITMDASVLLFVCGMSFVSTLVFGLVPSLSSTTRIAIGSIGQWARNIGSTRLQTRLRRGLVVAEVTLAFTLVTTAGLLIQSLFSLERQIAGGVDSANMLTAHIPFSATRFADRSALNFHVERLGDRIGAIPGVAGVAFAEGVPPEGSPFLRSFQIADQPAVERARRPSVGFNTISPSYFRTIGLEILNGRALAEHDREGAQHVVVINETFARTYFSGSDAIGRRLLMDSRSPQSPVKEVSWEVVGVVEDEGLSPWTRRPQPVIYATREQNTASHVMLVVRAGANPMALQDSIRKAVSAIDPGQALADVRSMNRLIADYVVSDRLRSMLLSGFAAIAMTLAAIGLYGLLSYFVVQRRREIGIRSALGASATALVALVMREGMAITGTGLALGVVVSFLVRGFLRTMLFGVAPFDSATLVVVSVILVGTALGACYIPARLAARVDPLVALKHE